MSGKTTLAIAVGIIVFAVMAYFAVGFLILEAPHTITTTVGPRTVETPSP